MSDEQIIRYHPEVDHRPRPDRDRSGESALPHALRRQFDDAFASGAVPTQAVFADHPITPPAP